MNKIPVIAVFDVGKTNKKVLLFDEKYKVVFEESQKFEEITDEDGFPCEDVIALTKWVKDSFSRLKAMKDFEIRGVNFSAYGASFVFIDEEKNIIPPLYNYLKPFPRDLQNKFYKDYGGQSKVSKQTASPVLGSLNSGMQLYRLKYEKPDVFARIKFALHLPQYLSYILTSAVYSDITSIGCHTNLWNFQESRYADWVVKEDIIEKLAPVFSSSQIAGYVDKTIPAGVGLHDSSAALIPYLSSFTEPFILLSTGTWCISLNPFNHTLLSDYELGEDCLSYLTYEGKPVKASRLFAGYEHEQQLARLAEYFNQPSNAYEKVSCDPEILKRLKSQSKNAHKDKKSRQSNFQYRSLDDYANYEDAYHQLIFDIIQEQVRSINLVLKGRPVKKIFVDGGFSRNSIYMHLLAEAYPQLAIYTASVPQASALGAALAIHKHWNAKRVPKDIINLKLHSITKNTLAEKKVN